MLSTHFPPPAHLCLPHTPQHALTSVQLFGLSTESQWLLLPSTTTPLPHIYTPLLSDQFEQYYPTTTHTYIHIHTHTHIILSYHVAWYFDSTDIYNSMQLSPIIPSSFLSFLACYFLLSLNIFSPSFATCPFLLHLLSQNPPLFLRLSTSITISPFTPSLDYPPLSTLECPQTRPCLPWLSPVWLTSIPSSHLPPKPTSPLPSAYTHPNQPHIPHYAHHSAQCATCTLILECKSNK